MFSNSDTCEVGISDHHHLVSTMLNKKILKGSTKTLFYRDYKKFQENKFAMDVTHELQNTKNPSYSQFQIACHSLRQSCTSLNETGRIQPQPFHDESFTKRYNDVF